MKLLNSLFLVLVVILFKIIHKSSSFQDEKSHKLYAAKNQGNMWLFQSHALFSIEQKFNKKLKLFQEQWIAHYWLWNGIHGVN